MTWKDWFELVRDILIVIGIPVSIYKLWEAKNREVDRTLRGWPFLAPVDVATTVSLQDPSRQVVNPYASSYWRTQCSRAYSGTYEGNGTRA